jgi:hypothetical protein
MTAQPTETPTPRTEAAIIPSSKGVNPSNEKVFASFARTLETELAQAMGGTKMKRPVAGDYDPIEVLRTEVKRFKSTNRFNPMEVTGFYVQADIVLGYVDTLERDNATLAAQLEEARRDSARLDLLNGSRSVVTSWPIHGGAVNYHIIHGGNYFEATSIRAAIDAALTERKEKVE